MMKIPQWQGSPGGSWIVNKFVSIIFCSSILFPWSHYPLLVLKCKNISKTLPFFAIEDFNSSPQRAFILLSYVEVQAQIFASGVSLPRIRNPFLYDFAFIDGEAHEWDRLFSCWAQGRTTLAWAFVRSLGWAESFNKDVFFSLWLLCYTFLYGFSSFLSLFSSPPFSCLLSYVYFPLEISSILYTTTIYVSRIGPYQTYASITIIVSNEWLQDNCIVPRSWKNLLFGVMPPKFNLNVWKHTINNYGFTFLSNICFYFFPTFHYFWCQE